MCHSYFNQKFYIWSNYAYSHERIKSSGLEQWLIWVPGHYTLDRSLVHNVSDNVFLPWQ